MCCHSTFFCAVMNSVVCATTRHATCATAILPLISFVFGSYYFFKWLYKVYIQIFRYNNNKKCQCFSTACFTPHTSYSPTCIDIAVVDKVINRDGFTVSYKMPQWKVNKYWIYSYLVLYAFPHTTCKSTCITIVFTCRNVYCNERSPPVKQYLHWCLYHSERKPPVKHHHMRHAW